MIAKTVFEKVADDKFFVAITSCEHHDAPKSNNFVRMSLTRTVTMRRITPTRTSLEMVSSLNFNGHIPRAVNNAVVLPQMVCTALSGTFFFSAIRSAGKYCNGAATELGLLFVHKLRDVVSQLREEINNLIRMVAVLQVAHFEHRILDELLLNVMTHAR